MAHEPRQKPSTERLPESNYFLAGKKNKHQATAHALRMEGKIRWEQKGVDFWPPLQNANMMSKKQFHWRTWTEVFLGKKKSELPETMITYFWSKRWKREQCKTPQLLLITQQLFQCLLQTSTRLQTHMRSQTAPPQPGCLRAQQTVPAGPALQEETKVCLGDKEDHQRERAKKESKSRVRKG